MTSLCSETSGGRIQALFVFAKCDLRCWLTRKKLHPGFDFEVSIACWAWHGLIESCPDAVFNRPRNRMRAIRMDIERVRHAY